MPRECNCNTICKNISLVSLISIHRSPHQCWIDPTYCRTLHHVLKCVHLAFGCIKLTSRASYSARALACQIEAWTGSQMNRVRIPAVRCIVTAAGFAFHCLNSPFYFIHQNGVHFLLARSNAEGIANTLPPMSLNVKCRRDRG